MVQRFTVDMFAEPGLRYAYTLGAHPTTLLDILLLVATCGGADTRSTYTAWPAKYVFVGVDVMVVRRGEMAVDVRSGSRFIRLPSRTSLLRF